MSRQSFVLHHNLGVVTAAFIGVAGLTTGPAMAESMVGDQSFERAHAAPVTGPIAAVVSRTETDWSMALPEGVSIELVAEYAADIPGVEIVQLRKMTLKPGATVANLSIAEQLYCIGAEGEVSVVDHTNGTSAVYATGDHWTYTKGEYTLSNPGAVDNAHYFYAMVPPLVEEWQPSGFRGARYMGKL